MPAAIQYDPNDAEYRRAARAELLERRAWMAKAWSYYYGDHPKPLKVRPGRPDNNVIINLVAQHADHTVSFAAPEFPMLDLDPQAETAEEEKLKQFWEAAGDALWLTSTMLAGVLGGHTFIRMLPPEPGEMPRIATLNPGNVLVAWAADDYETALWYEVYYRKGRMIRRQDIVAPGLLGEQGAVEAGGETVRVSGDEWLIFEYERESAVTDNAVDREPPWRPLGVSAWEWSYPPVIDWPHLPRPGSYYGNHELGHLALNDAVNKVASDIKAILRVHAAPRRVAVGIPPSAIKDTAIDNFWAIEGKTPQEVDIKSLEMESDLASSMNFLQFLVDAYLQQARVIILSGGPDAYKGITNLGIKAAFASQLGKTQTLHRNYGGGIARVSAAALEMMGLEPEEPKVIWKEALPVSELEMTQTQVLQIANMLQSREGAALKLGNDWQKVLDQLMREAVTVEALAPGAAVGVSG